jgi:branched-chain amino acid transport system substrate-binding protein
VSGLAEGFEKVFIDGGGRVVGKEPLKMTAPDFPALVSKVADARPDVLYLPQTSLDANAVGTQVKQRGLDVVMLGGDGWNLPGLDPAAAEGGYFTDTYAADEPRAAVQSWLKKYEAEYGAEPLPGAALGYDAATMLFTAIENAGSADPVKVKDALATLKDFEAVTGKTSMDAQHNPLKSVVIFHVTQGKVEYSTSVAP